MQKMKWLFAGSLCIAAIMMLVGCNILDNLIKEGGGSAPLGQILNRSKDVSQEALPVVVTPEGEQTVKLYFSDKDGKILMEQSRTIPKTLSLARETVNQWLRGPTGDSGCYPAASPATKLIDISIKNGVATVDLSKEYLQPFSNVTAETALYGLVNTVAQFSTVELVKVRIEGQEIRTYRGIDLDYLRFRNDLIGYSSGHMVEDKQDEKVTVEASIAEKDDASNNNDRPVDKRLSPSSTNLFFN